MNNEKKQAPRCPYCDAEMRLEDNEDVLFGLFADEEKMYWYQCNTPSCGIHSPANHTKEGAYKAAMKRRQEPNRVLTLDEVLITACDDYNTEQETGGKPKMKKYEFTGEVKSIDEKMLHRIRAVRDIPEHNVKAGDLGGWLETEENLSHNGAAWVMNSAYVMGKARVTDSARVMGNARVMDASDYIAIGAIGSRNDTTTFYRGKDGGIYVSCGCFNGTIDDFAAKVKQVHAGTKHERTYLLAIELAKAQIATEEENDS